MLMYNSFHVVEYAGNYFIIIYFVMIVSSVPLASTSINDENVIMN